MLLRLHMLIPVITMIQDEDVFLASWACEPHIHIIRDFNSHVNIELILLLYVCGSHRCAEYHFFKIYNTGSRLSLLVKEMSCS